MNRFCALVFLAAVAGLSSGCAGTGPVRGSVLRPTQGNPFIDFSFVDDRGAPRSLRQLLGDYTVLAFTRCDQDTHQPAVALLADIVRENRSVPQVHVFAVDIHRPASAADRDGRCHLIEAHEDVASICDGTGAVSQLYGVGQEDWLVVVDSKQCISFSGPMRATDRLRAQLKQQVERLRQIRERGHFRGYRTIK